LADTLDHNVFFLGSEKPSSGDQGCGVAVIPHYLTNLLPFINKDCCTKNTIKLVKPPIDHYGEAGGRLLGGEKS
jgi:hypothetical protein